MTRKRTQEETTMTDPNDNQTGNLLPPTEDAAGDSQERAASLLQLQRQAAALDQENAPPDPAQDQAEVVPAGEDPASLSNQVQGMIGVLVGMLSPAFPSLKQIYTPQTCTALGDAVAPVMVKHGWNLGDVYGKYSEEITLAMVAIPLGMATYQGVKGDIETRKRAAEEQHQEAVSNGG